MTTATVILEKNGRRVKSSPLLWRDALGLIDHVLYNKSFKYAVGQIWSDFDIWFLGQTDGQFRR